MITDRLDPPGILKIPEIVNVSVATGSRIIHISGQVAVDAQGKVVGTTHLEQTRKALEISSSRSGPRERRWRTWASSPSTSSTTAGRRSKKS
jgi:hypothetical protein